MIEIEVAGRYFALFWEKWMDYEMMLRYCSEKDARKPEVKCVW